MKLSDAARNALLDQMSDRTVGLVTVPPVPTWPTPIPVSDLPPITATNAYYARSDYVLAYDRDEGWLIACYYVPTTRPPHWSPDLRGWSETGEAEANELTITHWLPLPPVPEGAPQ